MVQCRLTEIPLPLLIKDLRKIFLQVLMLFVSSPVRMRDVEFVYFVI